MISKYIYLIKTYVLNWKWMNEKNQEKARDNLDYLFYTTTNFFLRDKS